MDAAHFELHVSLPADARFGETMRDLAAHAARYAGSGENDANRFGKAVEAVVVACLERSTTTDVPVVLRRGRGPVEFLIGCQSRIESSANGEQISIRWTREHDTEMCCVALEV
jgi:hypothetical protein